MEKKLAATKIKSTIDEIRSTVGVPVFDEWAFVELDSNNWKVLFYQSPRREEFKAHFREDVSSLHIKDLQGLQIGEFGFSHKGYGTKFDAFLCVGENVYAIFNHTTKTADQITASPSWKVAQKYFEDLQEQFILDPVAM